jgi:hypothetical protein
MKINKISHWIVITGLAISLAACNIGEVPPPAAETSTENSSSVTATDTPVVAGTDVSGACANPLMPIKADATWNYKLTGAVSDTFTRSILSVHSDGFTDQDVFGTGVTRQGEWTCDNGNLIALNPASGVSANVTTANMSVDFQTTEFSGVTLPAAIHAGDTWAQTATLEGTQSINGTDIPARNQFINSCTAIGPETVTVEAGTFEATRFDCVSTMNITITMAGEEIQAPLTFNSSNWYAENIGLLKTTVAGDGLDSTIELVSYNIP